MAMRKPPSRRELIRSTFAAGAAITATPLMVEQLIHGELFISTAYGQESPFSVASYDPNLLTRELWPGYSWRGQPNATFSTDNAVKNYIARQLDLTPTGLEQRLGLVRRTAERLVRGYRWILEQSGSLLRCVLPPVVITGTELVAGVISKVAAVVKPVFREGKALFRTYLRDAVLPVLNQATGEFFEVAGNYFRGLAAAVGRTRAQGRALIENFFPSSAKREAGNRIANSRDDDLLIRSIFHPGRQPHTGIFCSESVYTIGRESYMLATALYDRSTRQDFIIPVPAA